MEEEASINFKALRAKFQEEALMAESRASRPTVAGKPKHIPPPGGHCSSVVNSLHIAVENKTVPRVFFRDALRTSGGKRPISFPPQTQKSPPHNIPNGDVPSRQSLKDRHMALVFPILPKEPKPDQTSKKEAKLEVEQLKECLLQTKTKKKGLLLPFKSSKMAKASSENGEEPTYADLTSRPSSAPGELPSIEKHISDDRASLQGSEKTSECTLSSPDIAITPPSTETHGDSENRVFSTLEKAKKKFSRRQVVLSTKPKSTSPDRASKGKPQVSPQKSTLSIAPDPPTVPPPINFPNLAYISARPFFKGTSTFIKSPLDKHFGRDRASRPFARIGEPHPPSPPKKPLPDDRALGPLPIKPPRPPVVDLTYYISRKVQDGSRGLNHAAAQEPATESASVIPVLDAPEFPDFETSEIETTENGAVDIAALDLEASDLINSDLPEPDITGPSDFVKPQSDWSMCDLTKSSEQKGNPNIIPLNPASLPEPINHCEFPEPAAIEQWSQSEEATIDPSSYAEDTDLGGADCHSTPEDAPQDDHTSNFEYGIYQQEIYHQACDNVYEDVENISKFTFNQNSRKRKGLKNPYAENNHVKEESGHNIWQRNPRGGGDHVYLSHSQINSKECQSPNTADFKEQKKREKQRLERERKEQKEREKKENEMKKKFKVTGEEEPMYHARVMVASKVRKNDLPVKSGDTVSIIRTTNCPKGKWLARDANHKYGYISVMNVELNIKEMLELGKKAQAAGRGGNVEADTISIGSRSSSHPVHTSSCEFTDDSEEWACEDETLSPSNESLSFPQQTPLPTEMLCGHAGAQHTLSDVNLEELHTQTRHEALQKLAIFFQHNKEDLSENGLGLAPNIEAPSLCDVEEPPLPEQEIDFTEMELLPPPPLYADTS